MIRRTCPVSDDPDGSKLCPQGTISFFSLMPSSSEALEPRVLKFGTGVQCNMVFQNFEKLGGPKIRGVKILDFLKIFISIISGRNMPRYTNLGQKNFRCKKLRNFSKILHYDFDPAGDV